MTDNQTISAAPPAVDLKLELLLPLGALVRKFGKVSEGYEVANLCAMSAVSAMVIGPGVLIAANAVPFFSVYGLERMADFFLYLAGEVLI